MFIVPILMGCVLTSWRCVLTSWGVCLTSWGCVLTSWGCVLTSPAAVLRLIRAHGVFMVVAWPVVFVIANLFAAFLKPAVNGAAWVRDVCVNV